MVIGADDDDPLGQPAADVSVELLLLLLHAARAPTARATAPSATAFLENQGRCALTPGSSFLLSLLLFFWIRSESNTRTAFGCSLSRVIPAGSMCRAINAVKCTPP